MSGTQERQTGSLVTPLCPGRRREWATATALWACSLSTRQGQHRAGHRKLGTGWARRESSLDRGEANNVSNVRFFQVCVLKGECVLPMASQAIGPLTCTAS